MSREIKAASTRLLNEFETALRQAREEARRGKVILHLDSQESQLQQSLSAMFRNAREIDEDVRFNTGDKNLNNLAEEFIAWHLATHPQTWEVLKNERKGGRWVVEFLIPSPQSLKRWKTINVPEFVFGSKFRSAGRSKRRELQKVTSGSLQAGPEDGEVVEQLAAQKLIGKRRRGDVAPQLLSAVKDHLSDLNLFSMERSLVTKKGQLRKDATFRLDYEYPGRSQKGDKLLANAVRNALMRAGQAPSLGNDLLDVLEDSLRFGEVKRAKRTKTRTNKKSRISDTRNVETYNATFRSRAKRAAKQGDTALVQQYLNARIIPAVIANMITPALVYRTGRFATSVEVTNVAQDPQTGEYVVQYTYMRDPYETFELETNGRGLATPDRDPKNIIGGALRKVAQEIALTRFGLVRK